MVCGRKNFQKAPSSDADGAGCEGHKEKAPQLRPEARPPGARTHLPVKPRRHRRVGHDAKRAARSAAAGAVSAARVLATRAGTAPGRARASAARAQHAHTAVGAAPRARGGGRRLASGSWRSAARAPRAGVLPPGAQRPKLREASRVRRHGDRSAACCGEYGYLRRVRRTTDARPHFTVHADAVLMVCATLLRSRPAGRRLVSSPCRCGTRASIARQPALPPLACVARLSARSARGASV